MKILRLLNDFSSIYNSNNIFYEKNIKVDLIIYIFLFFKMFKKLFVWSTMNYDVVYNNANINILYFKSEDFKIV